MLSLLIFLIPVSFLLISVILRRKLKYRNWFLSNKYLFDQKEVYAKSDISAGLLFEKLTEVIEESEFGLLDKDAQQMQLLASTSPNFWTWGENLYLDLKEEQGGTVIQMKSVTVFGTSSWGRNESNHQKFLALFEESLTI